MNLPTPTWNKTKIVATMGPACATESVLHQMVQAGVDVIRVNASHGENEQHREFIDLVRKLNHQHNLTIPILFDLQGPKIRVGKLAEPYPVQPGDIIELCTSITERDGNRLPMDFKQMARDVKPGELVLVEDGRVELTVLETNGVDTVKLRVESGTNIGSRKGVNLPFSKLSIPSMTNKDFKDVDFAIEQRVEWIALSFVRRPEDISSLRSYLQAHDSEAKIIAKIEKPEALVNIDAIIEAADGIMVARGDLGVEIYIEEVPFWQKKIVQKCNMAAKPVIVATQMLDSMIENRRPTRAETTDVANAVLDGADAVMLSGETSIGKYPVEVVRTMQKIVTQAELDASVYYRYQTVDPASDTFLSDSVCLTAVNLARQIQAKAIVGMTRSGYTAYRTSKFRPEANIYIFSDNRDLLTTLNLVWGVRAFYYDSMEGTNESIKDTVQFLKDKGYIRPGDCVINTASMPLRDRGRTNMVKITVA